MSSSISKRRSVSFSCMAGILEEIGRNYIPLTIRRESFGFVADSFEIGGRNANLLAGGNLHDVFIVVGFGNHNSPVSGIPAVGIDKDIIAGREAWHRSSSLLEEYNGEPKTLRRRHVLYHEPPRIYRRSYCRGRRTHTPARSVCNAGAGRRTPPYRYPSSFDFTSMESADE